MRPLSRHQRNWLLKIEKSPKLDYVHVLMIGSILQLGRYDKSTQGKVLNKLRKRFL
jgi:hypothetical protein